MHAWTRDQDVVPGQEPARNIDDTVDDEVLPHTLAEPEWTQAANDPEADDVAAAVAADAAGDAEAEGVADDGAAAETIGGGLSGYLQRIRKIEPLSLDAEASLVLQAQGGDAQALNRLIAHALPIVPSVAREFLGRGLPLEDLIEEGNLGLYRAVPRFDTSLGYRFSTYARWWVRHEIRTAVLNKGRLVRLPSHVFRSLSKARALLEQQRGAPGTGAGRRGVAGQAAVAQVPAAPDLEDAHRLVRLAELPLSLDHGAESGSDATLMDTLIDEEHPSPEEHAHALLRLQVIEQLLDELPPVAAEVLRRRYGFATGEPETLETIGASMRLSAERIRQIQKQAVTDLRSALLARGISRECLF